MKIAIDARSLMNPPTGVANYLITAINQISGSHPECELYLLVNRKLNSEAIGRIIKRKNIFIIRRPFIIFRKIGVIWYMLKVASVLNDIQPDYFWAPANILPPVIPNNIKTIVTVQDFVSKQYANTMMLVDRILYSLFFNKSVKMADVLTTLSNYTKKGIEKKYPRRKCKDIFVGVSIDTHLFKQIIVSEKEKKDLLERFNLRDNFILFVGTIEPRKNLKFLVSLMPELAKKDLDLLIVGAKGWKDTGIEAILNEKGFPKENVKFSGFVSKDELVKIYNTASLLVLPSINEGFGLPALEAMSCGCPVVAADNSALHEVVDKGGVLVKGWEKSAWISHILDVHYNRRKYVKRALYKSSIYQSTGSIEQIINRLKL